MFSGGTYEEVGRWLGNFLTSHAKREVPRAEVLLDAADNGEGRSYGVHLRLDNHLSDAWTFDYREVADNRGRLAWCLNLADQARARVRALGSSSNVGNRAV